MAQKNLNKQFGVVGPVDNTTFNTGGAVQAALKATDSGTHYNIDGTDDIIIVLPSPSTDNVGVNYSFLVTTAVGGTKNVIFQCTGNFNAAITLTGNASTRTENFDVAGSVLTLPNNAVVGTRVDLLCVIDNGTAQTWKAEVYGTPIATVTG